jgi:hypothetical protein
MVFALTSPLVQSLHHLTPNYLRSVTAMKLNRSTLVIAAAGIAASVITAASAFADATVDVDGVGFVGKGDVQ